MFVRCLWVDAAVCLHLCECRSVCVWVWVWVFVSICVHVTLLVQTMAQLLMWFTAGEWYNIVCVCVCVCTCVCVHVCVCMCVCPFMRAYMCMCVCTILCCFYKTAFVELEYATCKSMYNWSCSCLFVSCLYRVNNKTVYLEITCCSFLLLFASICNDINHIRVILRTFDVCTDVFKHRNIALIFTKYWKKTTTKTVNNEWWVIMRQTVMVLTFWFH